MKICVLIPNEEYRSQAGARIRYQRIFDAVEELDYQLIIKPIQDFISLNDYQHDIYIISKCYDARSIVVASLLYGKKCLGVDIFDDYFSQTKDSRFVRLRYWLSEITSLIQFAMCATPTMIPVVEKYNRNLPIHVMNDPAPEGWEKKELGKILEEKISDTKNEKKLKIVWFGIGDNPNFPVGLSDLMAFSDSLALLQGYGYEIELTILTNSRALTPENLKGLARLPIKYQIDLWSEEKEKQALKENLICFLPVNTQNFSIVKSLNRAVTALTSGAQILSDGYPLYEPLADFIYRSPIELMNNLVGGQLKLNEVSILGLESLFQELASAKIEASKLIFFLSKVVSTTEYLPISKTKPSCAVIHGVQTTGEIHKFVQRMKGLSVASPFCKQKLNFDIRFEINDKVKELEILICEKWLSLLPENIKNKMVPRGKIVDRYYFKIGASKGIGAFKLISQHKKITNTAIYSVVMTEIKMKLHEILPEIKVIHSELSKSGWWLENHTNLDLNMVV